MSEKALVVSQYNFHISRLNECLAKSLKSLTYYGCLNLAINTIAVTSYG